MSETKSNFKVSRRGMIAGTAAGLAAAATISVPSLATGPRKWRLVTSWPKNLPGPGTSAQRLADRITTMSEGRLTVTLYAAGEVVPAFEVFDTVSRGTVEMGHSAAFFWSGKMPISPFFTAVPFGLTPDGHNAWIYQGGGQQLWDELYGALGVKPFLAGNSGMQMGGWYRRPLDSLEDLQGLVVRMPGIGGEVLRRLGAVAVSLPPGEIYPALASGAIDGAEFLGPWSDLSFGFDKVAPYYYWPGFHEPNGSAECLVNRAAYDALPDDLRQIVAVACEAENLRGMAEADWHNAVALAKLEQRKDIALRGFPGDILKAARAKTEDVLAEMAGRDALAGRIYKSYVTARKQSIAWGRVARHAILDAQLRYPVESP